METSLQDIRQTYQTYFESKSSQKENLSKIFQMRLTSESAINSLQYFKDDNNNYNNENNENIKKFILPFVNKTKKLNEQYALTFFLKVEEYCLKGDYDDLLINQVATTLIQYYAKDKEKNLSSIILLKYYRLLCSTHTPLLRHHAKLNELIDDFLKYLDIADEIHDTKLLQAVLDGIIIALKVESSYNDCSLDRIEYLYSLAKKYYTSSTISMILESRNRLINMMLDVKSIIKTLPSRYHVFASNPGHKDLIIEIKKIIEEDVRKSFFNPIIRAAYDLNYNLMLYINGEISKNEVVPFFQGIINLNIDKRNDIDKQETLYLSVLPNIHYFTNDDNIIQEARKKILNFVDALPYEEKNNKLNFLIIEDALDFFKLFPSNTLTEDLYRLTIKTNFFLYLHSLIVGEATKEITQSLLDTQPDYFIGYKGYKLEEVKKNKNSILVDAQLSGLFHDIGKLHIFSVYLQQVRAPDENELAFMHLHPEIGANMVNAEASPLFNNVIYYHHRFYSGKDGYPKNLKVNKSPYHHISDIVSIADRLDFRTDTIGMCIDFPLSFDDILKKLKTNPGKRYSPEVINAICYSPLLEKRLEFLFTNGKTSTAEKLYNSLFNM